jgi:hypothetical protein
MAALFPRWSTTAFRVVLVFVALGAVGAVAGPMICVRTPYNTHQFVTWTQPVEFDHRHHVEDDGIECLYCHSAAERSSTAGVPTTDLCMGCHNQIWNDSPLLEVVRRSYFSGTPIPWRRVHALPDFVYFNHAVHVRANVACERCHGRVETMARVLQVAPLTMIWCLDCHSDAHEPARRLGRSVTSLTTCTACHR